MGSCRRVREWGYDPQSLMLTQPPTCAYLTRAGKPEGLASYCRMDSTAATAPAGKNRSYVACGFNTDSFEVFRGNAHRSSTRWQDTAALRELVQNLRDFCLDGVARLVLAAGGSCAGVKASAFSLVDVAFPDGYALYLRVALPNKGSSSASATRSPLSLLSPLQSQSQSQAPPGVFVDIAVGAVVFVGSTIAILERWAVLRGRCAMRRVDHDKKASAAGCFGEGMKIAALLLATRQPPTPKYAVRVVQRHEHWKFKLDARGDQLRVSAVEDAALAGTSYFAMVVSIEGGGSGGGGGGGGEEFDADGGGVMEAHSERPSHELWDAKQVLAFQLAHLPKALRDDVVLPESDSGTVLLPLPTSPTAGSG